MNFYIEKLQKFFASIAKYFSNTGVAFSWLFIIFMGLFGVTTLAVIISSSFSYEYVLSRAIDKINKFLTKNPRINDDNLVAFNNKMKEKRIPKVLRRQWQQFMLYREHEASYYMSFKHCVENPLKNSTYNQQLSVYKTISLILVFLSTLIGVFCTYQTSLQGILKDILIIPIFILVLYWIVSMVLNLIHNATTGDLYQNYQYFEINIDEATVALPEYVDYEVLFTQEEIRRGIPVLFEYIQKRAIEEQKELERARIKNVEHEKFNFDASGMDASLVLERSMQEAEDYIATRKKYMQDIEQVNNEISALENQYKENVKENQRLMQTSKESIDALKKQLEQATSSIEINYIKKQMKDEINRQQIAERDFDTLTDKHNKEIKELQEEVNRIQGEIEKAKQALETVMMSEFSTYSTKVYKQIESAVGEDQKEVINGYKKQINDLEEKLALKDEELDNVYKQYQSQIAKMEEKAKDFDSILKEKDDFISQVQDQLEEGKTTKSKNRYKKNQSENVNLDTERKDSKTTNGFLDVNNNSINNEEDTNLDSGNAQNFDLDNKDENNNEGFNYFDNEDLNSDDFDNTNTNDFEDADNTGEDLFNDNNDLDFKTSENNNFDSNDGFNFDSDTEEKFNYLDSNYDEDNDDSKLDKNDETFNYLSDDAEEQHHEKSDKDAKKNKKN